MRDFPLLLSASFGASAGVWLLQGAYYRMAILAALAVACALWYVALEKRRSAR